VAPITDCRSGILGLSPNLRGRSNATVKGNRNETRWKD